MAADDVHDDKARRFPRRVGRRHSRQAPQPALRRAAWHGAGALWMFAACAAQAQVGLPAACGPLANAFGPFDYRSRGAAEIAIVENNHFNSNVQNLIGGQGGYIGGDLDYVLRAFPNHHRALVTMMRLAEKAKTDTPQGAKYEVECYFRRAVAFARDDAVARMLYANFLIKRARPEEARYQIGEAVHLAGDNPMTHYNAGLLYLELKDYDKAVAQAHRAAALGWPLPDLRERLQAAGEWRTEPSEQKGEALSSTGGGQR